MKQQNLARSLAMTTTLAAGLNSIAVVRAQQDSTPPSAVTDLRVVSNAATSVTLNWTAHGDDNNAGTATQYDIRYSTSPIASEAGFSAAIQVGAPPAPRNAGSQETLRIEGLSRSMIYYFSVKAIDEAGNAGGLGNEASGNTQFAGYGYATQGGSGRDVYHVTSLADGGPGTLRDAIYGNRNGPRTIVFDVGGSITLLSDILARADLNTDRITIDGSTAPSPGITILKQQCASGLTSCPLGHPCLTDGEFKIGDADTAATQNVILTHLRFQGNYKLSWGACNENSGATLGVQYHFQNVVLDHLTIRNAVDSGPDLWTGSYDSSDVTYSNNLIAFSNHPLTISDSGGGGSRNGVTIYRNVLARSGERMPQVRYATIDFDFRNNIIFDWGANQSGTYGMRIPNDAGQSNGGKVMANIVANYFIPGNGNPRFAFYYGRLAGSESSTADGDGGPASCSTSNGCASCPAQGVVVTNSFMGELWVSGNVFPSAVCEKYSTVSFERAVAPDARVATDDPNHLVNSVIPVAGTRYRVADEQALLSEIAAEMGGVMLSAPTNLRIVP